MFSGRCIRKSPDADEVAPALHRKSEKWPGGAMMRCLFALFAVVFPRLALFIVWVARLES